MKIEKRFINAELRAESQGDEMALVGYASKFNTQSEDLGGFRETVMPGAFARSIREGADVKFLKNHDPSLIFGRTKAGNLKLEEDGVGLRFRVVLPPTQAARDLYTEVKQGLISNCSFAFTARDQSWEDVRSDNGDMYASRKLMDVDLMDCSAVTYPAYNSTEVSARELRSAGAPEHVIAKVVTENLRSAGCPEEIIKKVIAQRGTETQPFTLDLIDLPTPPDPKLKEKWFNAFIDAYKDAMKKGGTGYEIKQAVAMAIVAANNAVQPKTEVTPEVDGQGKKPTSLPYKVVDTDGDNDGDDWERYLIRHGEIRRNSDGTWSFAVSIESRLYKSADEVPDYVPADKKAQWKEVWNSAYKKAKKEGKSAEDAEKSAFAQANGVAGPNADKKSVVIIAEERDGKKLKEITEPDESDDDRTSAHKSETRSHADDVSDPDSPDYDPDDPDYDPDLDETKGEGRAARYGEDRDGKTKTVAGKVLHAKDFAWVGDPNDPSTWKLPIHDENHARNALARFNQTQGIPPDKKNAVYKKIVAAAKKFGIKISEEDSIRCGYAHSVTEAILAEGEEQVDWNSIIEQLQMKQRLIDLNL